MGKAKNLGAISEFEWPAASDGGLTVFTGWHGLGKTTLLNALNTLATGKGKPPVRDRAKSGELEAHGMTLKFGARTTRTGELEIVSMEGKWSLADLIDPKIADPQAADAKRIKALVMLAGVEPDIELFAKCLQDTAAEDLSPETLEAPDLLAMAEKVKRDLEAKARKTEGRAENARGRVQALRQASEADGELPGKEWTADAAQAELEASLGELGAVRQAGDRRPCHATEGRQCTDEARRRQTDLPGAAGGSGRQGRGDGQETGCGPGGDLARGRRSGEGG
jgi:energy-coupling factor transporter ATP-binding protein EcfA2